MSRIRKIMSDQEIPLWYFYPSLQIFNNEGDNHKLILPEVILPNNYKTLVPEFYRGKGRKTIEEYTKNLESIFAKTGGLNSEIRLNWSVKQGLRNISIGIHGGFDVDESEGFTHFREHNLGYLNGIPPFLIATAYVKELLKRDKSKINL